MPTVVSAGAQLYHVYFLDSRGHSAKSLDVEASSDGEACELAAVMLSDQVEYPGIEVWDHAKMLQHLP